MVVVVVEDDRTAIHDQGGSLCPSVYPTRKAGAMIAVAHRLVAESMVGSNLLPIIILGSLVLIGLWIATRSHN